MDRRASSVVPSVCVQIPDQPQLPTTPFEPHKAIHTLTPCVRSGDGDDVAPPERRLTVLAMQLAVLEKVVSLLGTLAFITATVALLGGFAITLGRTDFWCITVLLLTEGARIQGRSHELEWQQRATPTWRPPV
ncbi:uncharacterized protein [Triticum aestivum]|uniref:uncharacterized protein n=1 Tax=Triticum aestivum TaxID=4565 RepID=UPI001D004A9E|nr:uncharacterized protein LOC123107023 [Triticum aestivum]